MTKKLVINSSLLFISVIAVILTAYLVRVLNFPTYIASSVVGLLFCIPQFIFKTDYSNKVAAIAYCVTFIGVTSTKVFNSYIFLILASIFGCLLYLRVENKFKGFGGKLGAIAFCSVCTFVLVNMFLI